MKKPICKDIEKALGKDICTPKDFDMLRDSIYNRLHILVSATTLKRIWGYLNEDVQTRQSSFDILAQFIGYPNYKDYIDKHTTCKEELKIEAKGKKPEEGTITISNGQIENISVNLNNKEIVINIAE